ncbi:MAG: TlpA family protein disulfide reductase [Hyphomonadaceae bacterium]|nr:TlpA family protein disulfide reductase [Hyphomonadaceae bacterium]
MLQRRTVLIAGLAAATPAYATTAVPLPPSLDELSGLPLQTLDGADTTLGQHLGPGPAVISFWASWCAPCVEEAMHLSTVRHRYDEARLNIIGLNVELIAANDEGVRRFLDRTRPTYKQLRADMSTYQAFGGAAQLNLPRLFVFDATGRPTAAFGAPDAPAVNRAIAQVVS